MTPERCVSEPRCSHSGADFASAFSKNDGSETPSGHRLRVAGRPAMCGSIASAIEV